MTLYYRFIICVFLIVANVTVFSAYASVQEAGSIAGKLHLDDSWSSVIYLSHIPTMEDRNRMSADMIIGKADVDSEGCFEFDISFLPQENNLFRLHMVKKNDSPYSLIIGGNNENHMFLLANANSIIYLENRPDNALFDPIVFTHSDENLLLSKVNDIKHAYDSTQMIESPAKRLLKEDALESQLRLIADTCPDALVGLYAIYNSCFEDNYTENRQYYKKYLKRWRHEDSLYFEAFRAKVIIGVNVWAWVFVSLLVLILGLVYLKHKSTAPQSSLLQSLSIQERKVFAYLQTGMSNQQIADECNVGLSTVKTHVRNIYAKLDISSRKEALDFKD